MAGAAAFVSGLGWDSRPVVYAYEILRNQGVRLAEAYIIVSRLDERFPRREELLKARTEVVRALGRVRFLEVADPYDVMGLVQLACGALREIQGRGLWAVLNLTPGRRTITLALYIAGCLMADAVLRMVYLVEETQELIDIPFMPMEGSLTAEEREVLEALDGGSLGLDELARRAGLPRGKVYRLARRLEERGLLRRERRGRRVFVSATPMARLLLGLGALDEG